MCSKGENLIKNVCTIQVWLLFGVTFTTSGHCNPDIIQCYQRQFRIESWHDAEAYLQTNTFVLQLECKYWRTKPFCSVCMVKRAIKKVCCMSLCHWSQLDISYFPDGSIVQIFSADIVTSFMDCFLKNFKVIFCIYFRPCFSAAWIILFFHNFHSHFPYFDALVFVTQVLYVGCLQSVHFCFLFYVTLSVCNVESMMSGDWLIGKVFEGGSRLTVSVLVWRDWE